MTAEIAVMNREAVALAADSAVSVDTESGTKVYNSANKIHSLSDDARVALMVYASAHFLNVPWETIAKIYRTDRVGVDFMTIAERTQDFLDFLNSSQLLFPDEQRIASERAYVRTFLERVRDDVLDSVDIWLNEKPTIDESEVSELVKVVLSSIGEQFEGAETLKSIGDSRRFREHISSVTKSLLPAVFEEFPLDDGDVGSLCSLAARISQAEISIPGQLPNRTGVVIAGFGTAEIYPGLDSMMLEGFIDGKLRVLELDSPRVDGTEQSAVIVPFAQRDTVDSFLSGIEPTLNSFLRSEWELAWSHAQTQIFSAVSLSDADQKKWKQR